MKSHRLTVAGMCLATALTFTVAGCSDSGSDGDDTHTTRGEATTAPADPVAELTQAAGKLATESYKLNMKLSSHGAQTGQMIGVMDQPNKVGKSTLTISAEGSTMKAETLYIGSDIFLKVTMDGKALPGIAAGKWTRLDSNKLPKDNPLGIKGGDFDPTGSATFLKAAATDVKRVDAHNFSGTFDASKAIGTTTLTEKDVKALGAKGRAVPFTAATDAEGHLVKLVIDMPAYADNKATTMTATYSDFGAPTNVAKPADGEIAEASDEVYEMFRP